MIGVMEPSAGQIEVSQKEKKHHQVETKRELSLGNPAAGFRGWYVLQYNSGGERARYEADRLRHLLEELCASREVVDRVQLASKRGNLGNQTGKCSLYTNHPP